MEGEEEMNKDNGSESGKRSRKRRAANVGNEMKSTQRGAETGRVNTKRRERRGRGRRWR